MKKLRVAVLYGGRSGEHEVSLQSAASVINYLDRDRFEIVPVAIDKQGRWHLNDISLLEGKKSLPVFKDAPKVVLPPNPADPNSGSALIRLVKVEKHEASTWYFPSCMGLSAKTERFKDYSSSPIFRMLDAECSHRRSLWTRR